MYTATDKTAEGKTKIIWASRAIPILGERFAVIFDPMELIWAGVDRTFDPY